MKCPMPEKALDKNFWAGVRDNPYNKKYLDELHALWENYCEDKPIYALVYSDFFRYFRDGNRPQYENAYFSRRLALDCSALLSLIYPEEEKYFIRLQDEIYAICDEYTWSLPAHQQFPNQNFNCHIDLFASETSFALSEIYTMLEDRLELLIKSRIRAEIDRRIITPFPITKYWWDGNNTINWTAVCSCGVACTYMLMHPELYSTIEERINHNFDNFFKGYSKEGICYEGCGYWDYGYGFFTMFADMYYRFTDGRVDWFADDRARNASSFIQKQFLSGKTGISFADVGGCEISYRTGTLHYLAHRYPDEVIVPPSEYSFNYDTCGRFGLQLRSLLWFDEEIVKNEDKVSKYYEYVAEEANWYIKRTPSYGFALKGGEIYTSVNHNDVGTFIFARNGKQRICDFGAGVYSSKYFGPDRFTIAEPSSRSHAVPIINGTNQVCGAGRAARDFEYKNGVVHLDIAPVYPTDAIEHYYRDFTFDDNGFTVTDTAVFKPEAEESASIVSRIPVCEVPTVSEGCVSLGDTVIRYNPEECSASLSSEESERGCTLNYVDFTFGKNVRRITLRVE